MASSSTNFPRRRAASTSQRHASACTPESSQNRSYLASRPSMVLELNPHTLESCRGLSDASFAAPNTLGIMHRFDQPNTNYINKYTLRYDNKSIKFSCSVCQRKALCLCQSCASRKACFYKKRKAQTDLVRKRDEIAHDVEEVLRVQTLIEKSLLSTRESAASLRFRIEQKKSNLLDKKKTLQDVKDRLARAQKNTTDLQLVCKHHDRELSRNTSSTKKLVEDAARKLFSRERLMALQLLDKVFPLERQFNTGGNCECFHVSDADRRIPEQIADAARSFKDGRELLTPATEHSIRPNVHYSINGFCLSDCGDYGIGCMPRKGTVFQSRPSSNSIHSAIAALSYGVQLVSLLPFIFDFLLPCHISLRDIALCERLSECSSSLGIDLSKLSLAVVHLCLNQGIDPSVIEPKRPFDNLMVLYDAIICSAEELTMSRPFEITDKLLQTIENDFKKIQLAERERTQLAEDDWCLVQDRDIEMISKRI